MSTPQESVGPSHFLAFHPMGEVPQRWRAKLRRLTVGSEEGAMVRWSYHDGSTWALVVFEGTTRNPANICGWAVFTLQEAEHPIIGVYVDPKKRGRGYGTELVTRLLEYCGDKVPYGEVYAVADWWPKYTELISRAGFAHIEWD